MKKLYIKIGIYSGIYIIIFTFLIIFAFIPTLSKITSDRSEFVKNESKLIEMQNKYQSLAEAKKNEETNNQIYGVVSDYLPDDKKTSDFVVKLEAMSSDMSLNIPSITTGSSNQQTTSANNQGATDNNTTNSKTSSTEESKAATDTSKQKVDTKDNIEFTLKLTSNFGAVMQFISNLESFPRYNSLYSVSISNYKPETDTLELNLKGNIYYGR